MESYLSKKRREKQPKKSKPKPKEVEDIEEFQEEEKKYFVRKNILHKILDFISGEKEEIAEEMAEEEIEELEEVAKTEIDELEDELEELEERPRLSIVDKIKRWLYIQDEMPLDEVEDREMVDEEIKTALKIQNKWLSQLSNKKIKEFKDSEDYEKYKEILEKYNLIKK